MTVSVLFIQAFSSITEKHPLHYLTHKPLLKLDLKLVHKVQALAKKDELAWETRLLWCAHISGFVVSKHCT